ncbi:type II toxin-antitoxin system RelE/ParE family toxin [Pantoea agglomerans]|uniref:type II toxin-antitoxin system RelE/ParE family toxin n=1 Tax=Enterobacter agglomerans TaxID=549 RepID=UPI003C7D2F5E
MPLTRYAQDRLHTDRPPEICASDDKCCLLVVIITIITITAMQEAMELAIYIHKRVDKEFSKLGITDADLCIAATEVMQGKFEADLGGGVIKKRVALQQGKSGGARSIVFFKQNKNLFFYDGWGKDGSKKSAKEIEDDELLVYKKLARSYLVLDEKAMSALKTSGTFREVNCNENQTSST